jgi:HlyD family secretion protein
MLHSICKRTIKTRHLTVAALAVVFLAGCSSKQPSSYQGYVEGEFVNVASSESGRLERLLVARGQQAPGGTLLFALETEPQSSAVLQAQQQLAAAEAQLKDLRTGKRPPEVDVIRAQLAQALAQEKKSAAKLVRDEAQFRSGGLSQAQLDDTRAEAASNADRVRELKSQIEVAALPGREEQIRAQAATAAAARAALDQAEWKLRQKGVAALRSGLVFDTLYREGEWVPAGSPVVRMLPPENVKVRFFVPEPVLGAFSPGQKVVLHCDGCPADIPARVTYISTECEYTPPVIYSNETRAKLVFMIEAHPSQDHAAALHPGQPVDVRVP